MQCIGNGRRVEHQLVRQRCSQPVHRPYLRECQAHAALLAVLQVAEHHHGTLLGGDGIAAGANMVAVVGVAYQHAQSGESCRMSEVLQFHQNGVRRIVFVNVDVACLVDL